jgi:DUF4097 and DUF4098 domain-containing protein YvlB
MRIASTRLITRLTAALAAAVTLALPAGAAFGRSVDEHRAADPQGQVEIIVVTGRVDVVGWDKPEIEVASTLGADVEKLDITTAGSRTTVRAVLSHTSGTHSNSGAGDSGANLIVHVPQKSSLTAALITADLTVKDLQGNQNVHTVSGDITTVTVGEARVRTVSGDVRLTAGPGSQLLEVATVSGDVHIAGAGGEVSVNTVSGDATLALATVSRAHLKTVSGDFAVTLALAPDGRFEAQSYSGNLTVNFPDGLPPAEFDVQSFSGELSTCFGRKPAKESYGPGSRLSFREGAGTGQVRIDSKSGDVSLCAKR